MIRRFWERIRPRTEAEAQEAYLAQSVDMVDLERRLNIIGHRPDMFKW
jgi:hypothetical protein